MSKINKFEHVSADVIGSDVFQRLRDRSNPYIKTPAIEGAKDFASRCPRYYAETAAAALSEASDRFPNQNVLTLAGALAYNDAGFYVIDGHALDERWRGTGPGGQAKLPRGRGWQGRASKDKADTIAAWTGKGEYATDDYLLNRVAQAREYIKQAWESESESDLKLEKRERVTEAVAQLGDAPEQEDLDALIARVNGPLSPVILEELAQRLKKASGLSIADVRKMLKHLRPAKASGDFPLIPVDDDYRAAREEALAIMVEQDPPSLFHNGGRMIEIAEDENENLAMKEVGKDVFKARMEARMDFMSEGAVKDAPNGLVNYVYQQPLTGYPPLHRVTHAPVFGADKTLVTTPGCHVPKQRQEDCGAEVGEHHGDRARMGGGGDREGTPTEAVCSGTGSHRQARRSLCFQRVGSCGRVRIQAGGRMVVGSLAKRGLPPAQVVGCVPSETCHQPTTRPATIYLLNKYSDLMIRFEVSGGRPLDSRGVMLTAGSMCFHAMLALYGCPCARNGPKTYVSPTLCRPGGPTTNNLQPALKTPLQWLRALD